MHSHKTSGRLPPPPLMRPTATHMHSHKPTGRLPLLSSRPAVILSAITAIRPVTTYTAWWQRHRGVRNLPGVFLTHVPSREPATSTLDTLHTTSYIPTTHYSAAGCTVLLHIASLVSGLSQLPHLKLGTSCRPNWKRPPVPLTVSHALLKHFYFSLSTAVKHVLADFCNAPSVRL